MLEAVSTPCFALHLRCSFHLRGAVLCCPQRHGLPTSWSREPPSRCSGDQILLLSLPQGVLSLAGGRASKHGQGIGNQAYGLPFL